MLSVTLAIGMFGTKLARYTYADAVTVVEGMGITNITCAQHATVTAIYYTQRPTPTPNPKEFPMSNQATPKSRPIETSKPIANLFPARFLRPDHLVTWGVTQITVTIDHLQEEEVTPHPGQPAEWKPVLYFRTKTGTVHPQGFLVSAKVDAESLSSATAATTVGDLLGKQITIQLSSWKNKTVLRINPQPVVK
jgi:hypothetical protein